MDAFSTEPHLLPLEREAHRQHSEEKEEAEAPIRGELNAVANDLPNARHTIVQVSFIRIASSVDGHLHSRVPRKLVVKDGLEPGHSCVNDRY